MSGTYGNLPNFNAGQVLSAEGHLNALQQYITLIHDDVAGVSVPGQASTTCYVRHVWDTLAYSLVRNSGTVTVKYNSTTVLTIAPGDPQAGTVDLSGFGFTVNEFYAVTVTGDATIYYLREQNTTAYPTLAAFTNGSTPTAAEWQALNTYSATLADNLDVPLPLNTRVYGEANFNLQYPLVHRGRNLVFSFGCSAPYQCNAPSSGTHVQLWGAGTSLFDRSYGASTSVEETLDLATLIPSLAIGSSYRLNLIVTQQTCAFDGDFWLFKLYEYPSADDAAPGWTPFTKWEHGDWVWGNAGGSAKVSTIKANLEALGGIVTGLNYMTPQRASAGSNSFLYGIRRRRFLHYKTYANQSCSINWVYQGEAQQTTLPESSTAFMVADLDSLGGLTIGTHYWIGGTEYALEDSHV